jgi:ElaB/YqjD/DUF883 family membrane-anchored ribosome-binding protein
MDTPKIVPTGSNGSAGNWDSTVDQAKTGAHTTIDKVSESARPAVDKAVSTAHETVDRLSDSASQAATALSDKMSQVMEMQEQLLQDARVRVRDRPVTALAIAAAAGFLLSSLLRSR